MKKFDNNPFRVEKMRNKLAFQNRLSELRDTYTLDHPEIPDKNTDAMWSDLNQHEITNIENPMAWDRVHKTVKLIKSGGSVLDIGFGSGIIEELLINVNPSRKLYGIDIAKKSVKSATNKYPQGEFKVGSILDLPYKGSTFDCVLVLEVLEHIQPHLTFLALGEIIRVLKKNGQVIISVPLNEGLEQLVKEKRNLNAHVRVYTPELVKAELRLAGFSVISEQYLFAFHKNYKLKSLVAKLFKKKFPPNNIILLCQKN